MEDHIAQISYGQIEDVSDFIQYHPDYLGWKLENWPGLVTRIRICQNTPKY